MLFRSDEVTSWFGTRPPEGISARTWRRARHDPTWHPSTRTQAILEGAQSSPHADTGQVLLNLGVVYRLEKKLDQAGDTFQRGLAAVTLAWGPNDPRLPQWMESLAGVLRAKEDYAGAEELEIRATRIRVLHAIR